MRGKCNVKSITYRKKILLLKTEYEKAQQFHQRRCCTNEGVWFDSQQGQRIVSKASEPSLVPTQPHSGQGVNMTTHPSYIAKIKLLLRSTANDRSTSRDESLKILCCIIYKHQRPKAYTRYIEVTTTKMKSATNKSIITRIFCFDTFNIVNFSVVLRKCNSLFSLFSVSGK